MTELLGRHMYLSKSATVLVFFGAVNYHGFSVLVQCTPESRPRFAHTLIANLEHNTWEVWLFEPPEYTTVFAAPRDIYNQQKSKTIIVVAMDFWQQAVASEAPGQCLQK